MTSLLLIRHGHAEHQGSAMRVTGWTDAPLSPRGRFEVDLLAARLMNEGPFDGLVASSLQRALDTARSLALAIGTPVQKLDDLREIHCGSVDGHLIEEVRFRHPALWAANERQDDPEFRWPGGESYREFRERCLRGVNWIHHRYGRGRVAVVTHAGVISQILGAIAGISAARWEENRPKNASLTVVEWNGKSGVVLRYDDVMHLPDSLPTEASGVSERGRRLP
jgi:broad specificity phosphatase PhoE